MKLLPLGTVIQIKEQKVFVLGYSSVKKKQGDVIGYFVAPYPLGFTSVEKVLFIPHDYGFGMVSEGYQTKASEALLDTLAKSFEVAKAVPRDELAKLNQRLKEGATFKKGVEQ